MNAAKRAAANGPSQNNIPVVQHTASLTKTVVRNGSAKCATCDRAWAGIRNLSAVAAIHARAHGHRVVMTIAVRVTFAPAVRTGGV